MRESLFSPLWYRVAEQHPHLRAEVRVQRQQVRDQRWYLLVNGATGRQFRVNERAWAFIGRCDGTRSVEEVWNALLEQLRDDAPTQSEVIQILNQLDEQDLVASESAPDAATLQRRRTERTQRKVQGFVNPFAMRIPLGDPTPWLRKLDALPPLLFSRTMLVVWVLAIAAALLGAASHWDSLTAHAGTYMATPRYLLLAWLVFPVLKALHELAHALAVRRWGGAVNGVGFSLFVLVPAPYVDASAAAAFRERYQRMVVGAAGMMVELFIAAAALAVWLNVQPGWLSDIAFVTMFIASISTVVFNGNPLLPFDAYFILCDAFDVPNLAPRSRAWWGRTAMRVLGSPDSAALSLSHGEGKWLIGYAPLSFVYRLVLSVALVIWLGSFSTALALVGSLFLGVALLIRPALSGFVRARAALPQGAPRRRAATIGFASAGVLLVALCAVPMPFHTTASGVVWPPEQARVRPGTDGFVTELLVRDGERVKAGQVLLVLEDPALHLEHDKLTRRVDQLTAGRYNALATSPEEARNVEEEIIRVQGELARVQDRLRELAVRSRADGVLAMPQQQDLPGTFVRKGSTIAHVLEPADIGVRAALPEYEAALLRESTQAIEVRLADGRGNVRAELLRDIPAATYELPSAALGDRGGGPHATDPADADGIRTQAPIVIVDLKLPATALERIGGRAWIRFDHGAQPLAVRWFRQVRQVLLHHFNPAA